ncbi:hypothetical protein pipiens_001654 [Culex pipiens pipiens]|uniref:Uncharacterized protein n=1 Tax=Culex pipiens pipiens TaxID=38569 RepID=A0ABD1CD51_CULPP
MTMFLTNCGIRQPDYGDRKTSIHPFHMFPDLEKVIGTTETNTRVYMMAVYLRGKRWPAPTATASSKPK